MSPLNSNVHHDEFSSGKTKGVAFEALESQSRYPSIVPRYKEKVESNVLYSIIHEITLMAILRIWNRIINHQCNQWFARTVTYSINAWPV